MNNSEIISNIKKIYNKFPIPPSVIKHCLLVRDVAEKIIEQLNISLNKDLVLAAALVHDLGNIAKIDFDSKLAKTLYSKEERIFWDNKKKAITSTYSKNPDELTKIFLKELSCDEKLINLLEFSRWSNIQEVFNKNNWEAKILAYADYRVGPFGVVSLKDRLDDLKERYALRIKESNISKNSLNQRNNTYFLIEEQLKEKGLKPDEIN